MNNARSAARIVGVDIARFVALAGMMATHILPSFEDGTGELTFAQAVAGGRASALFAVLAGVSLALTTGGTTPVRGRDFVGEAARIAARAVLIAGIGLSLGELDSNIAVILTYYGVLFLVGIPFLVLRARWLLAVAALWIVAAPVVAQLARPRLPGRRFVSPPFEALHDPAQLLSELFFTGHYPAWPWLAYLLVGIAIGRTELSTWRTPVRLAMAGGALVGVAVVVSDALLGRPGVKGQLAEEFGSIEFLERTLAGGFSGSTPSGSWWWLAVRAPHTATPFDLGQTIGSALLVISICLLLGRLLPSLSAVVFGAGAMTLTLYTAHVVLRDEGWDGDTSAAYLGQLTAVLVAGAVFHLAHRRGPLEALAGGLSGTVRRWVVGRQPVDPNPSSPKDDPPHP